MDKSVLVVDGVSTGRFFPGEIKKWGLRPLHLSSGVEKASEKFSHAVPSAEQMSADYAEQFAYSGSMEELVALLQEQKIVAVVPGCESGVELADALSAALDLPNNGLFLSKARRDKFAMQEAVQAAGLRGIQGIKSDSLPDILAWRRQTGMQSMVVKPLRSAGTEGIRFCQTEEQLEEAFQALVGQKSFFGEVNSHVLVQERVAGTEYAANFVSRGGRHVLSDLWEYNKVVEPGGAPLYNYVRLVVEPDARQRELVNYAKAVLTALGIAYGASHAEIMLTDAGPVLIECGARPMGGAFPPELMEESLGYTQVQWTLDSYLDEAAFLQHLDKAYRPLKHMLAKFFISSRDAELAGIPVITLAAGLQSARKGNFIAAIDEWRVVRTVDLLTAPATLFLCHAEENVLMEEYRLLRQLETEAQNQLFEAATMAPLGEWIQAVPDDGWLKPEAAGAADAQTIWDALQLTPGMDLLDCPCGDGRVGVHLAGRGVCYTGVDINPRFVATAEKRMSAAGITAVLATGDIRDISYEQCFDAVLNWSHSFGYFDVETDFLVLRLLAKALRPGGKLLLEAPNRETILPQAGATLVDGAKPTELGWNQAAEVLTYPVKTADGEVLAGARLYSFAQYQLLIRLAGLEMVQVWDEKLAAFAPSASKSMLFLLQKPHLAN